MSSTETIWRYMSLAKFIDLLSTASVYCCRADRFEDSTEGEWFSQVSSTSMGLSALYFQGCLCAIQKVNRALSSIDTPTLDDIRNVFDSAISPKERYDLDFTDDVSQVTDEEFFDCIEHRLEFLREMEEKHQELVEDCTLSTADQDQRKDWIKSLKTRSYISSWFSGNNHSIAMWKAYGLTEEGVAITTTRDRLKSVALANQKSLPYPGAQLLCADVIYVDESTEDVGPIIPRNLPDGAWMDFRDILLKHSAFAYEQEYRLSVLLPEGTKDTPGGIKLNLGGNLEDFIDSVYLNPLIHREHWFVDVVRSVLGHYGVDKGKIQYGEIRTEYSG